MPGELIIVGSGFSLKADLSDVEILPSFGRQNDGWFEFLRFFSSAFARDDNSGVKVCAFPL
jgi:hypothetical protein